MERFEPIEPASEGSEAATDDQVELLLRVEVSGRGVDPSVADVAAQVDVRHPVHSLIEALVDHFGLWPGPGWTLARHRQGTGSPTSTTPGEHIEPGATLGEVGLVSGELVLLRRRPSDTDSALPVSAETAVIDAPSILGRPAPSSGPRAVRLLRLVVSSGPDAGRSTLLSSGSTTIGRDKACGLVLTDPLVARLHLRLYWDGGSEVTATAAARPEALPALVLLDGEPIGPEAPIEVGGSLRIGASVLVVEDDRNRPVDAAPDGSPADMATVAFHRTPYYPTPVEPVTFEPLGSAPDGAESAPFAYLAALTPLVLGIGLAVLYSPRFLIFAAFSPVVAVAGHFDQRRRGRRRLRRAEARFRSELEERAEAIAVAVIDERTRRMTGSPDLATLAARARDRAGELWNRDRRAADFLTLRFGSGDVRPLVAVQPETRGTRALRAEADTRLDAILRMRDVPITVNLLQTPVLALLGDDRETSSLMRALVVQACCLHSPEDLVVAAIVDSRRGPEPWLAWLPHLRSPRSPLPGRHRADDQIGADRLLAQVLAVAEHRRGPDDRRTDEYWPRILIVIDGHLEPEPSAVSRLLDLAPSVGITVVWLSADERRVPRQAGGVVSCRSPLDPSPSVVSFTDPNTSDQVLITEQLEATIAAEVARYLAPLRDASSTSTSSTPPREADLRGALAVGEIDAEFVLDQWRVDRGDRLPFTIGVTATGPVALDLVADGPHALIGGTSGSGKSELLISLVASLLVLNPPDRLNVLFVDFKGGASTEVFRNAPHTVGCVTNLDAVLARRALVSLGAELHRRMDLLRGRAKDLGELLTVDPERTPPSLLIVIDEFATLVKEVPEFMAGLIDIAQRGRSLGVHVILATQRPSGAVNENILANTNLRISLRMLDGAESQSIIGSPDAALIPTSMKGRGLLKLGAGRPVPFQGAWSGAAHRLANEPPPILVSPLDASDGFDAQCPSIEDSGLPGGGEARAPTQLDDVLVAICRAADRLRIGPVRSPWLDELPAAITLEKLAGPSAPPSPGCSAPAIALGLVDDPEAQAQYPALVDLAAGGGLLVYGNGGAGKTTVLRTLAVGAALDDDARGGETLTIFAIDFASRQLAALSALPQWGGIATADDLEALTRIIIVLEAELERRFGAIAEVAHAGDDQPDFDRILLLIDDYGSLVQSLEGAGASGDRFPWLERIDRLIVDGRQVGLFTAVTATRPGAVRAGVRAAMSTRLVLRQSEPSAYTELDVPASLLGGCELPPGRGILNGLHHCQVALPGVTASSADTGWGEADEGDVDDDVATARGQQRLIHRLGPELKGQIGPGLMSEPLMTPLSPLASSGRRFLVPLGVSDVRSEPVEVDLRTSDVVVNGPPGSGRSSALAAIADQLSATGVEIWFVGPAASPLASVVGSAPSRFGRSIELAGLLEDLALVSGDDGGPVLLIDDFDQLDDPVLDGVWAELLGKRLRFVASTVGARGFSSSPLIAAMKQATAKLVLQPEGRHEIRDVTGVSAALRPGLSMPPGRGVLVVNRLPTVVQLPKYF